MRGEIFFALVAGLYKLFRPRHYEMKTHSSREKFGHLQKKLLIYYFSASAIVDSLKGVLGKSLQCLPS